MNQFNLEQFKQGVPAYTRDGRKATFVGLCNECQSDHQLIVYVEEMRLTTSLFITGEYDNSAYSSLDLIRMQRKYDHIKKGDLVMVWDNDQTHLFARLRRFVGYDADHALASTTTNKNLTAWDNCLTVEEYTEKYL